MSGRIVGVAFLLIAGLACIDDNIPPRPSVDGGPSDGGDASQPESDGGVDTSGGDGGLVLLASASPCERMDLVVVGGTLFWTEEATGTVKSVSTSGGAPTTIASTQVRPGAIAVDGTTVFWVAGNRKIIYKKPVAGGNTSVFVASSSVPEILGGENDINALLVAGNTLFFGRYIYASKIPTDGTTPKVISRSPDRELGIPGAFALDATHLYQPELAHNAVTRELLDGTQRRLLDDGVTYEVLSPDRIAVSQGGLVTDAIAVVDDDVIWADGSSIKSKVVSAGERDPFTVVTTSSGSNPITGFVVSGDVVFFGESSSDTVEMASVAGGAPTIIATDQLNPGQFAADATNIYWRTADCRIMKLAKP